MFLRNKYKLDTYFHLLLKIVVAGLQMCHLLLSPGLVSHYSEQKTDKVYRSLYMIPTLEHRDLAMYQIAIIRW